MRNVLAWALAALCLLVTQSAHAGGVAEYEVEIDLRLERARAAYRIRLAYDAEPRERKTRGFKFLGPGRITKPKLLDSPGAEIKRVGGFRESRVDFVLATGADGRPEPIAFTYEQSLPSPYYTWTGREYSLTWLHRFDKPVHHMEVVVLLPASWSIAGYECTDTGGHTRCTRTTTEAEPVVLVVRDDGIAWSLSIAAMIFTLAGLGFAWVYRAGLREWTHKLGFLPEQGELEPPPLQQSYRAPPPIPIAPDLAPKLSPEDLARFRYRYKVTAGVCMLGLLGLVVVLPGRLTVPLSLPMAFLAAGAVGIAHHVVLKEAGRTWMPPMLLMGMLGVLGLGGLGGLATGLVLIPGVVGVGHMIMSGSGSGSGRYASYSTFSGGGGGGCGGGGCGGGCGGCGS